MFVVEEITATGHVRSFQRVAASMLVILVLACTPAWACFSTCDGTIDTTWADNGSAAVLTYSISPGAMLPLADGKILVIANCTTDTNSLSVCATRLKADGSLDASFGVAGRSTLNQLPGTLQGVAAGLVGSPGYMIYDKDLAYSAVGMSSAGHIVIGVGNLSHAWVARLRADGRAIDNVLVDPLPQSKLRALLVQRDGKVVLLGHGHAQSQAYVTAARFLPDLSAHDSTFGSSGVSVLAPPSGISEAFFHDLTEAPDGALVLTGEAIVEDDGNSWHEGYVARLTAAGSYDSGFDNDGRWSDFYSSTYTHVVVNSVGKIFVGGAAPDSLQDPADMRVAGLFPSGITFASNNYSAPECGNGRDSVSAMSLQPDGKLLVAGSCYTPPESQFIELLRLTKSGALDAFDIDAYVKFEPVTLSYADAIGVGAGGILVDWYSLVAADPGRRVTKFKLDAIFKSTFED